MAAETIEFTAAREARQKLEQWYTSLQRVDERARAAETTARTRTEAMTAAADELAVLRQEAAQLGREMRAVETLRATRSLDLPQRARLTEIDAKLGDENTPLSERLTMELERLDLLDEAAGRGRPREARALDAERDDAQMQGLSRAAGKLRSKAALAEAKLRRTQERLLQADAELRRARGLQATREATVLALADKTVRRLAFRLGIALEPGQSLELASQFIRTAGGDIEAALMRLRTDLGEAGRAGGVEVDGLRIEPDIDIMQNALRGLSEREAQAATALREGLRMADDAADVRAARLTATEIENAPKVEGTVADEIAEAQAAVKEIEDVLAAEERQAAAAAKAEGREPPKPSRAMEAINEEAKDAERMAKAYEAAAVCAIGRA